MIKAPKDLVHLLKIIHADFNLKIKICDQITYLFHFFFLNLNLEDEQILP